MKLTVGEDGPSGGLVFWVNDSDRELPKAIEAAPRGWYTGGEEGDDCQMIWCLRTEDLENIHMNGTAVGEGPRNFEKIDSEGGMCVPMLQINSFMGDEWMLPTIDELRLMYENLHSKGLGGFDGSQYWSCSVFAAQYVSSWNFERGEHMYTFHNTCLSLRPIRYIDWD
jgi:hypothetical protein